MSNSLFRGIIVILILSAVLVHTQITNLRTQTSKKSNGRAPPSG